MACSLVGQVFFCMAADRVPLSESSETPQETPAVEPKVGDSKLGYMDDIEYHRMAELLDVDYETRKDHHVADKLSYLYDWAKEAIGNEDRLKIVEHIRHTARGLGLNMVGNALVTKLHQWARLDSQRQRLEREMNIITNNDVQKD